jgi:hypothetical protein
MNINRDDAREQVEKRLRDEPKIPDGLPAEAQEALKTEMRSMARMRELGFEERDFGEWHAQNCRVTLYSVMGKWELDIVLPNGSAVGCDVPIEAFGGRTADEIKRRSP